MDFSEFKQQVHRHFGLYLEGYKEPQLKRRTESLLSQLQIKNYQDYIQLLKKDEWHWRRFIDKITINVSEFFRNPEIFSRLEKEILPGMLKKKRSLKIWSAACADGAEPYSLAILLNELAPGGEHRIEATDIDPGILDKARQGIYGARSISAVSRSRLRRYFNFQGGHYYLDDQIKKMVNFRRHDLLKDSFGSNYDLIVCRNVVIYFTATTQNKLYGRFYRALTPGGVLFIGATESMFQYGEIGFVKIAPWFYSRPGEVNSAESGSEKKYGYLG